MLDRDYEFEGKNEREEVVLLVRRHWWYFIKFLFYILAIAIVLVVLLYFFAASPVTSWAFFISLGLSVYILATAYYKWSNTIYLLTNERIISADQAGWFSRIVSESTLENILFISHKTQGIASTMLNFGSIHIRASGVIEEEIVLSEVSDPYEIQQKIVATQKEYTNKEAETQEKKLEKKFWEAQEKKRVIR